MASYDSSNVLWLQFDEANGNIAYDQSGYNNHGTIYGATFAPSPFNRCLRFDGIDDCVLIPHSSSLLLDGDFTITAWISLDRVPPEWNGVIDKGRGSVSNFWLLSDKNNNRLLFGIAYINGTFIERRFPVVELGVFNFYVFGVEGSNMFYSFNGGPKIYSALTMARKIAPEPIALGSRNEPRNFERVSIDEVRIFNRALTNLEIAQIYHDYIRHKRL